ncbi:unnamed protein product, partial [Tenebrio molitor]
VRVGAIVLAVHDRFKHAAGQYIFLLVWRQISLYDVSLLNIRLATSQYCQQNVRFL